MTRRGYPLFLATLLVCGYPGLSWAQQPVNVQTFAGVNATTALALLGQEATLAEIATAIGDVSPTPDAESVLGRLASLEGLFAAFTPPGVGEGSTWSNGANTQVVGCRMTTTASGGVGVATGEVATLNCDLAGRVRGAMTPYDSNGNEITSSDKIEDTPVAGAEAGPFILTARRDTATAGAGAANDYQGLATDASNLLWTRVLDPCSGPKAVYVVDIVTAATTEINLGGTNGAATTGNNVYICGVFLGPTGGAQNLTLVEDDTDACASPTAGMFGGVTAAEGWNLAANGGTNIGNGAAMVGRTTATNRWVCLISSAAVQVSGTIVYALAP